MSLATITATLRNGSHPSIPYELLAQRRERGRRCEDSTMIESTMARARGGDELAFRDLTDPFRRELQLHCYRILGSLQDAEDALQETLMSAWRGLDRFEERASLRTWLYRIATNRCLNMLRDEARRPPQSSELPFEPLPPTRHGEVTWLEPYPDALLEALPDAGPGPAARYETKETIGLAFIAALQRLPTRQRVVLVLRDVLGFRAAEAAEMLDTSEATVNSALQRARSALEARLPPARERAPAPDSHRERELADGFAADADRSTSLAVSVETAARRAKVLASRAARSKRSRQPGVHAQRAHRRRGSASPAGARRTSVDEMRGRYPDHA